MAGVRVGFIGLGNIGMPMAKRLPAAGLPTTVFDVVAERVAELVAAGAAAADTPRALGAASDLVGVCVRDDADVRAVLLGADGVLAGAAPGAVVAIHSTVQPETVVELAGTAEKAGVSVIDACVTGGAAIAAQGGLTVMAGGDPATIERARPLFDAFAKKVVATGPLGSGCKVKLCNNLMTYLAWTSAFEAFTLARAAGLSQEALEEVTRSNGNMTDPMLAFLQAHKLPEEVRRSDGIQALMRGHLAVAEKDLAATLALARKSGVALPGAALVSQIMARVYGVEDGGKR
jgi:3-hydroxyisobutyrate dehydrogenase-like beta-hydroxyacid dehydrogenase